MTISVLTAFGNSTAKGCRFCLFDCKYAVNLFMTSCDLAGTTS